ncbi:MAG: dTDP-4-dehydrorhamnose 3,5-epimerase [Flavobacteriia bacterium]|nr:dTDP-4-dehydrorhamnose 3,5-epimerase [Flavobacteriia bacterium]
MEGVYLTPLKIIENPKGDILHALKSSSPFYSEFGEAYFSSINYDDIKGWKLHTKMILNLIVPVGEIEFVIYDDRSVSETKGDFFKVVLSRSNYYRLTIMPGLWLCFKGIGKSENILLNIASIEHEPEESKNMDLKYINLP